MSDYFDRLLADPTSFHNACYDDGFRLSSEQIERLHLEGARKRFAELRPGLSVLDKLAREQGIEEIRTLEDLDRKSTRLNLQSLMRISYAVFCLKKKTNHPHHPLKSIKSTQTP